MKILLTVLIALLVALQYRLWFGDGSIQEVWRLRQEAKTNHAEVIRLSMRNQALAAEVADLKSGLDAIEERARAELGMVGEGETFYQFIREQQTRRLSEGLIDGQAEGRMDAQNEDRKESQTEILIEGLEQGQTEGQEQGQIESQTESQIETMESPAATKP